MKALTQVREMVTEPQKRLIVRMIDDVANSDTVNQALSALSKNEAERLKGDPEFTESLRQHISTMVGKYGNGREYIDGDVESDYGNYAEYKPKEDLDRQIEILKIIRPGLGETDPEYLMKVKSGAVKLPKGGEKFFAIPNIWYKPGRDPRAYYEQNCRVALERVNDYHRGQLEIFQEQNFSLVYLRQTERAVAEFQKLSQYQGHPGILIVAAQFGLRHLGRSFCRARVVIGDTYGEFGLGLFAVCNMLLTHPERFRSSEVLSIGCVGDICNIMGADVPFEAAPHFFFHDGYPVVDGSGTSDVNGNYGSVSGFHTE